MDARDIVISKVRGDLGSHSTALFLTGSNPRFSPLGGGVRPQNLNLHASIPLLREIANCNGLGNDIQEEARKLVVRIHRGKVNELGTDAKRYDVYSLLDRIARMPLSPETNRTLIARLEAAGVNYSLDEATINIELKNSRILRVNINSDLGYIGLIKIAQDPSLDWEQGFLIALAGIDGGRESLKSLVRTTIPEDQYLKYLELCYANFKTHKKNLEDLIKQIVNDPEYQDSIDTISDKGLDKVAEFSKRYEDFSSSIIEYLNDRRSREKKFLTSDFAKQIQTFIDKGCQSTNPETKTFFDRLSNAAFASLQQKSSLAEAKGLMFEAEIRINDDTFAIGDEVLSLRLISHYIENAELIRPFFPLIKAAQQASWQDDDLQKLALRSSSIRRNPEAKLQMIKDALLLTLSEDQYLKYCDHCYEISQNAPFDRRLEILEDLLGDDSEKLKQYKRDQNTQVYLEADLQRLVNFSKRHAGFFDYLLTELQNRKNVAPSGWHNGSNRYRVLAIIASAKQCPSTLEFANRLETECNKANLLSTKAKK